MGLWEAVLKIQSVVKLAAFPTLVIDIDPPEDPTEGAHPAMYLVLGQEDWESNQSPPCFNTSETSQLWLWLIIGEQDVPAGKTRLQYLVELVAELKKKILSETGKGTFAADTDVGSEVVARRAIYAYQKCRPISGARIMIEVRAFDN
jgi:hypothetical protein